MSIFNNKKDHCNKEHSPLKHMLHIVLCCGLPIIIIFALPFISRYSLTAAGIIGIIAPFICPVMMGGMIFFMFRGNKHNCCEQSKDETNHEIPRNN